MLARGEFWRGIAQASVCVVVSRHRATTQPAPHSSSTSTPDQVGAGMLMHAPSCTLDYHFALSVPCFGVPGCCWQGVDQDTTNACISSSQSPNGGLAF